jgi:hypothetical protein
METFNSVTELMWQAYIAIRYGRKTVETFKQWAISGAAEPPEEAILEEHVGKSHSFALKRVDTNFVQNDEFEYGTMENGNAIAWKVLNEIAELGCSSVEHVEQFIWKANLRGMHSLQKPTCLRVLVEERPAVVTFYVIQLPQMLYLELTWFRELLIQAFKTPSGLITG